MKEKVNQLIYCWHDSNFVGLTKELMKAQTHGNNNQC